MQPPTASCLLHRQNKCQYLLVVRLFRINKCLLLLFIIWEKLQRKCLCMLFSLFPSHPLSLSRPLSFAYFETLSMLFVHVSNVLSSILTLAETCVHAIHARKQTRKLRHIYMYVSLSLCLLFCDFEHCAVLNFFILVIVVVAAASTVAALLFCFVTFYMVFEYNMPLPVVHFRWLSVVVAIFFGAMIDSMARAHEVPINELKFILTKLSGARECVCVLYFDSTPQVNTKNPDLLVQLTSCIVNACIFMCAILICPHSFMQSFIHSFAHTFNDV